MKSWLTQRPSAARVILPEVASVLGLFGLLGALFAGVVVDSVLRMGESTDADDTPEDEAPDDSEMLETTNIFSMLAGVDGGGVLSENAAVAKNRDAEDGLPLSEDTIPTIDAEETLTGGDTSDNIAGNGGDDQIAGGGGDDLLVGRKGDDIMSGGSGHDYLSGDVGNDDLTGGMGHDTLHGEDGDDVLTGDGGNDALFGHEGNDNLQAGSGDDTLAGGNGFDSLYAGDGDDELMGGSGRDLLGGGQGSDVLDGGEGSDTIWGQMPDASDIEADFLNGGTGDDLLMLAGNDHGNGGEGADVFGLLDIQPGDPLAQITDFDPMVDAIVVLYDPATHPHPQLSTEPGDAGQTILLLDGVPLASLSNGATLDLGAIALRAA